MDELLACPQTDRLLDDLLSRCGRVFRRDFPNDSGNRCFGLEAGGRKVFVKASDVPSHREAFRRVELLHQRVRHRALPPLLNRIEAADADALVFDWVEAEPLREADVGARFRALPPDRRMAAFAEILDLHVRLEEAGYVAEDLYDGCFLYDFAGSRLYVCDLDEYHLGPFTLDRERTLGSRRFMAPEEWRRGATIDARTNVCNLGRAAAVVLGDRSGSPEAFAGPPEARAVVETATRADPALRHPSVAAFAFAWRAAAAGVAD